MDFVQVVSQAVDPMRSLYAGSDRQLSAQLPDLPIYVNGDPTRLNQVVTNLLTNALRYTHEGGQVWLSLVQLGEQAILRVADDGIGLAADQLETIFGLFVQVNKSWARSHGGLGVGLSLVQELVGQHGGRVEAHSGGVEQGSEFVVYLPILPA
jgi:signal transduction histidine kinase